MFVEFVMGLIRVGEGGRGRRGGPGQYAAVVYDNKWYIACIKKRDLENQDLYVNFMHCCETASYLF